jgi:hypothetical protein
MLPRVPLSDELQARLGDPAFWRAYFFDDHVPDETDEDDYQGDEHDASPLVVEFPVGGGYALVLDIGAGFSMIKLGMRTPDSGQTLELGWDDQAHWHPDALRWAELDLIARAGAIVDPRLRHPGPVLALVARFVVLDHDDNLDAITPLMDAAFGPPPLPRLDVDPLAPTLPIDFGPLVPVATWWPRTRDWLHRVDGRHSGVAWHRHDDGTWTVDQQDENDVDRYLCSLRRPGGEFPFADWRKLVTAAEATLATGDLPTPASSIEQCWTAEERTATPRGSLIAARFGPSPLRDSRRYLLTLELPVRGRSSSYELAVRTDLDRTLREADRGWAESSGATWSPGRGWTAATFGIGVIDSLDAGIALIRQVLRRHRADPETRLTSNRQPIRLD